VSKHSVNTYWNKRGGVWWGVAFQILVWYNVIGGFKGVEMDICYGKLCGLREMFYPFTLGVG